MRALGSKLHDQPRFVEEVEGFCAKLLVEMGKLETPGRRVVSEEEERALRARIIPICISFRTAKELLRIAAQVSNMRGRTAPKTLGHYMAWYFDEKPELRQYEVLRKWLWRRTKKASEKLHEYNNSPARKKRIAENRPSKEEHAEEERRRYWAKKGKPMPPKRGYQPVIEQIRAEEPSELDESDITSIFQDENEEPSTQETSVSPPPLH